MTTIIWNHLQINKQCWNFIRMTSSLFCSGYRERINPVNVIITYVLRSWRQMDIRLGGVRGLQTNGTFQVPLRFTAWSWWWDTLEIKLQIKTQLFMCAAGFWLRFVHADVNRCARTETHGRMFQQVRFKGMRANDRWIARRNRFVGF